MVTATSIRALIDTSVFIAMESGRRLDLGAPGGFDCICRHARRTVGRGAFGRRYRDPLEAPRHRCTPAEHVTAARDGGCRRPLGPPSGAGRAGATAGQRQRPVDRPVKVAAGRFVPGLPVLLPAAAGCSRRPRVPAAAGRAGRPCPGDSRRLVVVPWGECNGQHPPIARFDSPGVSAPVDWEGCTASVIPGGWPIQRFYARSAGATGASPEPEEYFSRGCPFDTFRPAQCRHCGAR